MQRKWKAAVYTSTYLIALCWKTRDVKADHPSAVSLVALLSLALH